MSGDVNAAAETGEIERMLGPEDNVSKAAYIELHRLRERCAELTRQVLARAGALEHEAALVAEVEKLRAQIEGRRRREPLANCFESVRQALGWPPDASYEAMFAEARKALQEILDSLSESERKRYDAEGKAEQLRAERDAALQQRDHFKDQLRPIMADASDVIAERNALRVEKQQLEERCKNAETTIDLLAVPSKREQRLQEALERIAALDGVPVGTPGMRQRAPSIARAALTATNPPRFCPHCGCADWPENCPTACPSRAATDPPEAVT